jgi:hypothetical protein
MPTDRWSGVEIKCAILWRLTRRHGWANWIPADDLVTAVPSHERGQARSVVDELKREPYIKFHLNRGFKINNSRVDVLAEELRDICGYSEFRITATLSHFGGFD